MKLLTTICTLAFLALLPACGNDYAARKITITPNKSTSSKPLGKGVWMVVPPNFQKAASYDGYQLQNMSSSISLKTSSNRVEDLKRAYDPKRLKPKRMELLELSEVKYGDSGTGFLSVVHDQKKRLFRYFLAVNENGRTYNITAFCVEALANQYDPRIRKSLESLYIGEFDDGQAFKMASFNKAGGMIYTKDGQYPTASKDEAVVEWEKIESLHGVPEMTMVRNELNKLVPDGIPAARMEGLSNGKFYHGKSRSDTQKAFVAVLSLEGEEGGLLVKGYGNPQTNLSKMENFVRGLVMKTEVRGY